MRSCRQTCVCACCAWKSPRLITTRTVSDNDEPGCALTITNVEFLTHRAYPTNGICAIGPDADRRDCIRMHVDGQRPGTAHTRGMTFVAPASGPVEWALRFCRALLALIILFIPCLAALLAVLPLYIFMRPLAPTMWVRRHASRFVIRHMHAIHSIHQRVHRLRTRPSCH